MGQYAIRWSIQAKSTLKEIYQYYKELSLQGAKNVRKDLLEAPKTIHFSKQYQLDEINPSYRRIIVRDFKLLYTEDQKNRIINVIDIISTKSSPEILENK